MAAKSSQGTKMRKRAMNKPKVEKKKEEWKMAAKSSCLSIAGATDESTKTKQSADFRLLYTINTCVSLCTYVYIGYMYTWVSGKCAQRRQNKNSAVWIVGENTSHKKKVTTELAAQVSDDHDDDDDDDDATWLGQRRYVNALTQCKKCQCCRQLQKKAA